MEGTNILCSVIIFLYLCLVFLLKYYKNISLKKSDKYLIKIDNVNPTVNFYCCNLLNSNKLFWITLMELIDKKYYKLYEENEEVYLKWNKQNITSIDNLKVADYQKDIIIYINSIIENMDNVILLSKLDQIIRSDCNYASILNNYMIDLRKNTKELIGDLDRINNYKYAIVCTFFYLFQVFYFLTSDINFVGKLLITLPLTYFTIVISDVLKNKIGILTKKKYVLLFLVSIVISIITSNIWNNDTSNNYLIFHFLMGIFTYLYPLLIVINIYSIRTNYAYKNKIQKDLIEQMNDLEFSDTKNINYLYLKVLKITNDKKDKLIDKYFKILDL